MTYLRQWRVRGTRICRLPDYLALFSQLTVLDVVRNSIAELPPDIGETGRDAALVGFYLGPSITTCVLR